MARCLGSGFSSVHSIGGRTQVRPSFSSLAAKSRHLAASQQNDFAIYPDPLHLARVTQPLALVFYQKLLPGSQVVNRLQDLNYRVQPIAEPADLLQGAQTEGPMLIVADLESGKDDVCGVIAKLRGNPATAHIPIIAFGAGDESKLQPARDAGATVAVSEAALLGHLPDVLEQALRIE